MRISHDKESGALYFKLREGKTDHAEDFAERADVYVEVDAEGNVLSYCQMLWIGLRSRGDLLLVPFDQFSHHEPGPGPHQRD